MASYVCKKLPGKNLCEVVNQSSEPVINSAQDALDLLVTAQYECGSDRLLLQKQDVAEAFFDLQNGIAGEVLQKFANYNVQIAIVGDYSGYTSKPLLDFIYESNKGIVVCFAANRKQAMEKLNS